MNLLHDPTLTISGGAKVSLPELLAAMVREEVRDFPALRPHQRPAWHMFLAQLSALALWTAGREELPMDAADWKASLSGLTPNHADDEPWRLIVADQSKPAFLQPPVPKNLKWSPIKTPDALDMLITSRNHDLKQNVARQAEPEDWVFALVSLQTSEGYGGSGNQGIARMNGGSSSRPMLGLAPAQSGIVSVNPSTWWARDVRLLLAARKANKESGLCVAGGHALLWCFDWPESQQLNLSDLDPWFIEVCRRVRLTDKGSAISAQRSISKATRVDAKMAKGVVSHPEPWAPVDKQTGKNFTLPRRGYNYKTLCNLLFSGDWQPPFLAQPRADETTDMLLIAEGISRGNSKTEGFHSRVVPIPGRVVSRFSSETAASLSKAQQEEIAEFDKALRHALALVAAGGDRDAQKKEHFTLTNSALARFNQIADRLFFPSLWRRVEAVSDFDGRAKTKIDFLIDLWKAGKKELEASLPAIPCTAIRRPRAEARARRQFRNAIRRKYPELFEKENANAAA